MSNLFDPKEVQEFRSKVEVDRGVDKEEEKLLKEYDFYHGFIPREDISSLIRKDGDYLIRVSELESAESKQPGRVIVLSTYVDNKPEPGSLIKEVNGDASPALQHKTKLRNIIIRRMPKNRYMLEPDRQFDTLKELISYYQKNPGKLKETRFQLKNPIRLQKWELLHSDLKLGKQLGEGAFGEVRQGVWIKKKNVQLDVAVKLTKGTSDLCKAKIKEMMREARLMRNLRHKNIVRLHGVAVDEQPLYIVLELVKGGALNNYLTKNKCNLEEKMSMCLGAAKGVEYLHKNGVIHRDLAARNCLYEQQEKLVKISDFGLSRLTREYKIKTAVKLPIKWLAPETIHTFVFNAKTDVYSFGVMVYEIFADGGEPWEGCTNTEVKKSVTEGKTLPMNNAPEKVSEFISTKAFAKEPQDRTAMPEIVKFFEQQVEAIAAEAKEEKIPNQPSGNELTKMALAVTPPQQVSVATIIRDFSAVIPKREKELSKEKFKRKIRSSTDRK